MERFDLDLVSTQDQRRLFIGIRQALVCGFFMQVAHRGNRNNYMTIKDHQVCLLLTRVGLEETTNKLFLMFRWYHSTHRAG